MFSGALIFYIFGLQKEKQVYGTNLFWRNLGSMDSMGDKCAFLMKHVGLGLMISIASGFIADWHLPLISGICGLITVLATIYFYFSAVFLIICTIIWISEKLGF